MAPTYISIASTTLSSSAASVTFSNIPATYTDLLVRVSTRSDRTSVIGQELRMRFNNSSVSEYGHTALWATGGTVTTDIQANQGEIRKMRQVTTADNTANTFGTTEIYIPNYLSSTNKPIGSFGADENNTSSDPTIGVTAGLWVNTAAINRIDFILQVGNFVSGSTFHLYGIKNS